MSLKLLYAVWIFQRSFDVICYDRWVFSEGYKSYFKDWCFINLQPTCLFFFSLFWPNEMTILSKVCNPDNFESRNLLKLRFINIWGLSSNFVGCLTLLELKSPHFLALFKTSLDDSIDSSNFSVGGYIPLIGFAFYIFNWLYFIRCLNPFSSINHLLCLCERFLMFSLSLRTVFDAILSNIDEVLPNYLLNLFLASVPSICPTVTFPPLWNPDLASFISFRWLSFKLKRSLFSSWLGQFLWSF